MTVLEIARCRSDGDRLNRENPNQPLEEIHGKPLPQAVF
jgi:hypothetical protein